MPWSILEFLTAKSKAIMEPREHITHEEFSFRKYAWRQFKKNKIALFSLYILGFLVFVAVFADLIATDQPLYARYRGKTFFPAFQVLVNPTHTDSVWNESTGTWEKIQFDIAPWKQMKLESAVWAPIAYSPDKSDRYNRDFVGPFDEQVYKNPDGEIVPVPWYFRHYLGTNQIGQDVAAGLVHGTRISLSVGLVAVGIAAIIGIILGALAGFFGDSGLKSRRGQFWGAVLGLFFGFFYGFMVRGYAILDGINAGMLQGLWQVFLSLLLFAVILLAFTWLGKHLLGRLPWFRNPTTVPVDSVISRLIEIMNSMPRLLLILTIASLFKDKSIFLIMAILGLTSWTGIARFTRAELLRTRSLEYIQAARALGYNKRRIIFGHALPNSLAPVFISISFGIAAAILAESSLSFLGIGVPDDVVTWGSLLSAGRTHYDAWWMVVFPGFAIFLTVTIYTIIGEALRDALDPRLKQ